MAGTQGPKNTRGTYRDEGGEVVEVEVAVDVVLHGLLQSLRAYVSRREIPTHLTLEVTKGKLGYTERFLRK